MKQYALIYSALNMFLQPFNLLAESQTLTVFSESAKYEDHILQLADQVVIQYDAGKITANRASVETNEDHPDLPFKTLALHGSVVMQLQEQGTLYCDDALLNALTQMGHFKSAQAQNKVQYIHTYIDREGNKGCVDLQSQKMDVFLPSFAEVKKKVKQNWDQKDFTVHALGQVCAQYQDSFVALADRAICSPCLGNTFFAQTDSRFMGNIILMPLSDCGLCCIQRKEGDQIDATKIVFSPTEHMLSFDYPHGKFAVNKKEQTPLMQFSAQYLHWDEQRNIFTLEKQIRLQDVDWGDFYCDEQAIIKQAVSNEGRQTIESIEAVGQISIHYRDAEQKFEHTLRCPGKAHIDHTNLVSTFVADKTTSEAESQVLFKDYMGMIYADRMQIVYEISQEQKIVPKQLILEGNVYITNNASVNPLDSRRVRQYAYAQKLQYWPESGEMKLFGSDASKVLFFDQIKQMQVSAQQIHLQRKADGIKESIQGIGQVQFTLNKEEWARLKTRFEIE